MVDKIYDVLAALLGIFGIIGLSACSIMMGLCSIYLFVNITLGIMELICG